MRSTATSSTKRAPTGVLGHSSQAAPMGLSISSLQGVQRVAKPNFKIFMRFKKVIYDFRYGPQRKACPITFELHKDICWYCIQFYHHVAEACGSDSKAAIGKTVVLVCFGSRVPYVEAEEQADICLLVAIPRSQLVGQ